MSVRIMAQVFESDLGPTLRLVALALADYASDDGRGIYPSVARIAAKTGLSERSVKATTKVLKARGVLIEEGERRVHGGRIPVYRMVAEALPQPGAAPAPGARPALGPGQSVQEPGARPAPKPSTEPSEDNRHSSVSDEIDKAFAEFWLTYPRRQGRDAARRAFERRVLGTGPKSKYPQASAETILEGARRYAADPNLPHELTYVPLPATWLNEGRWADDPLPPRRDNHPAGREPVTEAAVLSILEGGKR